MWQALVLSIIYNKQPSCFQVVKLLAGGTSKERDGQCTIWYNKYYQRKHYIKHIRLVPHHHACTTSHPGWARGTGGSLGLSN